MTTVEECLAAIEAIETTPENYKQADRQRFYNGEQCTLLKSAQAMIDRINKRLDVIVPDEVEEDQMDIEEIAFTAPDDNTLDAGYVRTSTTRQSIAGQVETLKERCPDVELFIDEGISGTVPVNERPSLAKLLNKLRKGDRLWVWWIDRLGRNGEEVELTVRDLLSKGITIKTVNQNMTFTPFTGDTYHDLVQKTQLLMITAMAEAERVNRLQSAEDGRRAMREGGRSKSGKTWAEAFSGRKANTDNHTRILDLLDEGHSIRKVAEMVGVNPSTVQRVKKAHS